MDPSTLGASWEALLSTVLSTIGIYIAIVAATRVSGLRSFAKMSSFDFAATVAIGSILATIGATSTPLLRGVVALATLFALQMGVATARRSSSVQSVTDNAPLLLMRHGEVFDDALATGKVTRDDLRAKLREANVIELEEVRAVVLETTGDIAVLHGPPDGPDVDERLLRGVRGYDG